MHISGKLLSIAQHLINSNLYGEKHFLFTFIYVCLVPMPGITKRGWNLQGSTLPAAVTETSPLISWSQAGRPSSQAS